VSEGIALKTRSASGAPRAPVERPRTVLGRAVGILGSFGLAVVVLLLLTLLVLAGTFAQRSKALFDVQRDYFESIVVIEKVAGLPVPLPGGVPLLGLLFVNLFVGGVIRIRKGRGTAGILVAHLGILTLLLGGFVESLWSDKGHMRVWEGESAGAFQSYYDWEIAVDRRGGAAPRREYVLPNDRIEDAEGGRDVRFRHRDLPFDVVVSGWARNSTPKVAKASERSVAVDGLLLESLRLEDENAEANVPGALVTLVSKKDGSRERGLLWGMQDGPWVVERDGVEYAFDLRPQRWTLPFTIHLKEFVKRDHPGTSMPAEYSSYVTMVEGGVARDVHITMNEPLRHRGYTLYQSSFGPPNDPSPRRWYSGFAVSRNPSDRVPIIACAIIAVGLLWHFLRRLVLHILAQTRRAAARTAEATT
jgi:hypothetical protein